MDTESQSQDCEALPHPVNTGSYSNLFHMSQGMSLGDSAHSLRHQVPTPPRIHHTRNVAPPSTLHVARAPSPAPRHRSVTAPMATPDHFSPSPPTGHSLPLQLKHVPRSPSLASRLMPLANDAKYPTTQALITDSEGQMPPSRSQHSSNDNLSKPPGGSTNTGGLHPSCLYAPQPVAMGNSSNGRDLVGLRHVMPRHKESGYSSATTVSAGGVMSQPPPRGIMSHTPPRDSHSVMSHPPLRDSHGVMSQPPPQDSHGVMSQPSPRDSYSVMSQPPPRDNHEAMSQPPPRDSHGVISQPPHDGGLGIRNVPGAVMRPMSFVRAMEMSDTLALQERTQHGWRRPRGTREDTLREEEPDTSQALYGSSYEISV